MTDVTVVVNPGGDVDVEVLPPGQVLATVNQPAQDQTLQSVLTTINDGVTVTVTNPTASPPLTPSGAVLVGNARNKFRDGFASTDVAQPDSAVWTLANDQATDPSISGTVVKDARHIIRQGGDTGASSYLRVSMSPFVDASEVTLTSIEKFRFPTRIAWGITQSQRVLGQELFYGVCDANDADPLGINRLVDPGADRAHNSATVTVTSNVMVLSFNTPHGFKPGDRIIVYGARDTRLNVGPVVVTIPSIYQLNVPITIANGSYDSTGLMVRHAEPLSRAHNSVGFVIESATAGTATWATRRNGSKYRLLSKSTVDTASLQERSGAFGDAFIARGVTETFHSLDEINFRSWGVDSYNGMTSNDKIVQGIPDEEKDYRLHVRARHLGGMSKPIAKIISAVKSGTTTATITTDRPHGLTTASRIGIWGIRSQGATQFPNSSDMPITTIVDATTFTLSIGTAGTVTDTDGGVVTLNHGGVLAPGMFNFVPVSISRDSDGIVTLVHSGTITGHIVGEGVHLWGLPAALAHLEGAYKVVNFFTATLQLVPLDGSPVTGSSVNTTNAGFHVIRRTEHRLHFVRVLDYTRLQTEVVGGRGNTGDSNNAVPVTIASSATISTNPIPITNDVTESVTNLAAGALYSGASRDLSSDLSRQATKLKVSVRHLAGLNPGSVYLEQSTDNTTFYETWRCPVPSDGLVHTFEVPVHMRYYRWRFQNPAGAAQTAMLLHTRRVIGDGAVGEDIDKVLTFPLSTTPLAAAATFTGPTLDLGGNHRWEAIRAFARSDVDGTLFIEQSHDGTNWMVPTDPTGRATATDLYSRSVGFSAPVMARYVRVRYVNGATLQAAFVCQATLLTQ